MKGRRRKAGLRQMVQAAIALIFGFAGIALTLDWARLTPERESDPQTIEAAREEILRRPTWPYAWMKMASLLADQGFYGAELDESLRRTQELGAREHPLDFHRAILALQHLRAPLPPYSRELLLDSLRRERQQHPGLMQAYAFLHHRDRDYCALPDQHEQEVRWCKWPVWQHQRCRDRHFDAEAEKDCTKLMAYYTAVLSGWKNTVDIRTESKS